MITKEDEYKALAFGVSTNPIELYKCKTEDSLKETLLSQGSNLDVSLWLTSASKVYEISSDIRDYVLIPVPIMFTEIPNTNGDSVSIQEMLRFDPESGCQAYKSFKGKPMHVEHDNKVHAKAKGIILDVFLQPLQRFGNGKYFKLVELLACDRTKDPLLANSILSGKANTFSLGFYFKGYDCSICGRAFGEGGTAIPCEHTMPRKTTYKRLDGRLAYRRCKFIRGFETSYVDNPAYSIAVNNNFINVAEIAKTL